MNENQNPSQLLSSELHCSFCGKSENQVQTLIAGPNVYICSNCVIAFTHPLVSAPKTESAFEKCNICGKTISEIAEMIQANKFNICNECLKISVEIVKSLIKKN